MSPKRRRRLLAIGGAVLALCAALVVAFLVIFPGGQASIAIRLATGVGIGALQSRIDEMEDKAIRGREFTDEDRTFLRDFYTSLARGARLTIVLGQSGRLMQRYLDATGEPLELHSSIFVRNTKVQARMKRLRKQVVEAAGSGRPLEDRYVTPVFHMPHPSSPDSVFGLYYGTLEVRPRLEAETLVLAWRAEVPWQWPSYESLKEKHGDYHAESFPLPNPTSVVLGMDHALFVDNGLGEHLVHLGLARPFVAFSEWEERVRPTGSAPQG